MPSPLLLAALGALAAPVALLGYLYRRPLPPTSGRLAAPGLRAPVEVVRDRWGVPHLYAQSLDDLFFAQGYVHAQDRLWQMELNRRSGRGRLAELFGEIAFSTDRLLRTVGVPLAAEHTLAALSSHDQTTLAALTAYARGINAWLDASRGRRPLEFSLLGLEPEPWQPLDSVAWGKAMTWSLSFNWSSELLRAALVGRVGPERAARLCVAYPDGNPTILPGQHVPHLAERLLAELREAAERLPLVSPGVGSNAWVVDGARSATGRPLLANDPHLGLQMPSIWYENHLVCPELTATGVSFPGAPGVLIGHNADVAWGITAGFADTQDLYVERLDPADPTRYEYRGAWEQAAVRQEEIRVRGEARPRVVQVVVTRHGPILGDAVELGALGPQPPHALALRWSSHEPSHPFRAVLRINQARSAAEFRAALDDWAEPSQSFVYADRTGAIGYCLAGRVPVRARGTGVGPVPGWTGGHEWLGWLQSADLPQAANPPQGYLVTANNLVAGREYAHVLGADTANGFRARRIVDLLAGRLAKAGKLSADDLARVQLDQRCLTARPLGELYRTLAPGILAQPALRPAGDLAKRALLLLANWAAGPDGGELSAGSVGGALYELTQHLAMRRVFGPWLGDLTDHYLGVGLHPLLAATIAGFYDGSFLVLQRILTADEREWLRDEAGQPLSREAILALALADAIAYLRQTLGDDVAGWRWGRLHRAGFAHVLGGQRPLGRLFNRGPYPCGGDHSTVWQAGFVPRLPIPSDGAISASWRQIIDLADWDASRAIHTTGQSGHPASRHYDDLIPLWLRGEYHPLLWSRERVEAEAEARLWLVPAATSPSQPAPVRQTNV